MLAATATRVPSSAARVTRSGPVLRRRCSCGGMPGPDGECAACKAKRLRRQARGAGPAVAPAIVHDVLRSAGRPLDAPVRAEMESRFGHDFTAIRVHTDERAAESARAVGAAAYSVGPHIVFERGRYAPLGGEGRRLLAHELVHTLQQPSGGIPQRLEVGSPGAPEEREAERGLPPLAESARPLLRRTCAQHRNQSFYETAPNYCRDTAVTGQLHEGQTCFREVPRRSDYLECPPGDQVCFDAQGGCHDDSDEASPVESREPDGTCNLHFACSLVHGVRDRVVQTWVEQQLGGLRQRARGCLDACENQPWHLRIPCLMGCAGSGGPGP